MSVVKRVQGKANTVARKLFPGGYNLGKYSRNNSRSKVAGELRRQRGGIVKRGFLPS